MALALLVIYSCFCVRDFVYLCSRVSFSRYHWMVYDVSCDYGNTWSYSPEFAAHNVNWGSVRVVLSFGLVMLFCADSNLHARIQKVLPEGVQI